MKKILFNPVFGWKPLVTLGSRAYSRKRRKVIFYMNEKRFCISSPFLEFYQSAVSASLL
jgi:hypothetical protein